MPSKKPSPEAKAAGMGRRGHKNWTPEDEALLLEMARAGAQNWKMARKFNVGVDIIRSKLSSLIRAVESGEEKPNTYRVEGVTLRRYSIQENVKLSSDKRENILTS